MIQRTTNLVLPGFSYQRSRSRGSPFPTWGQSASLQVMAGSEDVLSSIDFFKVVGRFRQLHALSDRNTLIGSVQYGVIRSNDYDIDSVPLSQRFFAGGDRSVRGFQYQDISPTIINDDGEVTATGGRYLEVASVEYNYRFLDRGAVPFLRMPVASSTNSVWMTLTASALASVCAGSLLWVRFDWISPGQSVTVTAAAGECTCLLERTCNGETSLQMVRQVPSGHSGSIADHPCNRLVSAGH